MKRSFRNKVTFSIIIIALVVSLLYTTYNTLKSKEEFENMIIQEHVDMARLLTTSFDVAKAKVGVAYNSQLIEEMAEDKYVLYIRMVKPTGEIYLSSVNSEMGKFISDESIQTSEIRIIEDYYNDERIKTVVSPSESGYTIWLGFSLAEAEEAFVSSIIFSALMFLPVIGGVIVVSNVISKSITCPIRQLMKGVHSVQQGNLNQHIYINSNDEFGKLGFAFNQMIGDLKTYKSDIEAYNKNLKGKVKERTKELENTLSKLRQSQKFIKKQNKELREKGEKLSQVNEELTSMNEELQETQERLHTFNNELELKVKERTEEVEKLVHQKDEFIHQLGHDLKSPLTPIVRLLPKVVNNRDHEKTNKRLEIIARNVEYIQNITLNTLKLARLNTESIQFDFHKISVLPIINEIIDVNQYYLDEKHISVKNEIFDDVIVYADELQLKELLSNLFTNAMKFSNKTGQIHIKSKIVNDFLQISIHDQGVGMTKEHLNNIFNEFYKADPSRHELDSSGLGLSICYRIVNRHGGDIWAESEGLGKGSSFYFSLPLTEEAQKRGIKEKRFLDLEKEVISFKGSGELTYEKENFGR